MTQKLPLHTLKQIPRNSVKEFLKSVPEKVTDSKQYTRDYVSSLLREEGKENLSQENWELFRGHTESLYHFLPKIQKYRTTISLQLLQQFTRVFGEISKKEFEKLCENDNVRYILIGAKEKNLEKLIGLCKNLEDFVTVSENDNVRNVLMWAKKENFKKVWNLYQIQSPAEFEKLCENDNVRYVLEYAREKNLERVWELYQIQSPAEFEKLCECIYVNGELWIHSQGSSILEEILINILTNEKTEGREIRYFQERAREFLAPQEMNNTSSQGEIKKDISIYVRYGHTVNYPEIAEAIIVFVQEYKKKFGENTFIQNIRIIPRYLDKKPSEGVFKNPHTQFHAVSGDAFTRDLHDGSIALFLSNSHNSRGSENSPNIISGGMKKEARKGDIILPFELETSYQKKGDITETMTIQELYTSMFEVLQSVEERMIKK